MWESISGTIGRYGRFYYDYALYQWSHMTPTKYIVLLVSIGVAGWFFMKSTNKK